jgi:anti-sigma regulatory factor (Ser/Thr protein kinase)
MDNALLERIVPATYPEVGSVRRATGAFLHDGAASRRDDALIVVSELCTNAVEALANPCAEFTLRVEECEDRIVVEVEDQGPGFGPALTQRGADVDDERGRGLAVVRSIVDEISVFRADGHTVVHCVLYLDGAR